MYPPWNWGTIAFWGTLLNVSRMRKVGLLLLVVLFSTFIPASLFAQVSTDPYYEFLMGCHLEGQGDTLAALEAFERAVKLSPSSSTLHAEIAAFYLRQNRSDEAKKFARKALDLDSENIEAQRVLGLVLSVNPTRAVASEAVNYLKQVITSPSGATDFQVQFNLGRLYLLTDDFTGAIRVLQQLVVQRPYFSQARLMLARAQKASGLNDVAIATLESAEYGNARRYDQFQIYSTLGQYYEDAKRWASASEAYAQALAISPEDRDLRIRQASVLLALPGRYPAAQALNVLNSLFERNRLDVNALYLQSQAYRSLGNLFQAEQAAREILALEPNSQRGAYALSQVFSQGYRYRDVINYLEGFLAMPFSDGKASIALFSYLAYAYQSLGNYDKAIDVFSRAKKMTPDSPSFDIALIQTSLAAKRYADALDLAVEAQTQYPQDQRFLQLQARALLYTGHSLRALAIAEELVAKNPNNVSSIIVLADLYSESGHVDKGVVLLANASVRFPTDESILFRQGSILANADRYDDAESVFRKVLKQKPDHAEALNYLGYMFADRGQRLDEAIRLITTALDLDVHNPAYLDSLGWAYFKQGDLAEAEKYLSQAGSALPVNSVIQSHFGDLLALTGRYGEAILAWLRALEGDGEGIDPVNIESKIRDARAKGR